MRFEFEQFQQWLRHREFVVIVVGCCDGDGDEYVGWGDGVGVVVVVRD